MEPLFNERSGTLEFWFRPEWQGAWQPPFTRREFRIGRYTLLHLGDARRPNSPTSSSNSTFLMAYSAEYARLSCMIGVASKNAGWQASALLRTEPSWLPGQWHHLACVWNSEAEDEGGSLRLFLDGKSASDPSTGSHLERLGDDRRIRVRQRAFGSIQIGAFNNGLFEAAGAIAHLRISRNVRYVAEFAPPTEPFTLDASTTALFAFDRDFNGQGMTAAGEAYRLEAIPGVLAQY